LLGLKQEDFFTVKGTVYYLILSDYLFQRRGPHAAVSPVFVTEVGERVEWGDSMLKR
jgi:hypothetical protein